VVNSLNRKNPAQDSRDHSRLDSIDALRGIAALMVAGYHIWGHYGIYPFPSIGVVPQAAHPSLLSYAVSPLRWGYLGVSLFLVLSGFCIHLPFARKRKQTGSYEFSARPFYLRRLWRLYPAYAVSVIGTYLLLAAASHTSSFVNSAPTFTDLFAHLTLTHGYFDNYFYGIVHVYWSLALEFQLYLAYPLFLIAFRKIGLTKSILVLTTVSIVWRWASLSLFHSNLISIASTGPYAMMGFVLARMPEWLFGVWIAEWFVAGRVIGHERHRLAGRIPLGVSAIAMLFLSILSSLSESLWVFTDILFGIGFAFLIAAAIIPRSRRSVLPARPLFSRPLFSKPYRWLVWTGTISYSLYLFHMQLSWFANPWIREIRIGDDAGNMLSFLLRFSVLLLSIPIIALIYHFVEQPFLKAPKPGERYFAIYARIRRLIGIKTDVPLQVVTSNA
jgi:peptidoglycan/LPS O-acetylase OafA/YrhL